MMEMMFGHVITDHGVICPAIVLRLLHRHREPGSESESPKIISSMVVPVQLHPSLGTDDEASSMTRLCDDGMILTSCDNP